MNISPGLKDRCQSLCELCTIDEAVYAYAVSPRNNDLTEHEVAICKTCLSNIEHVGGGNHWQCLAGSVWNQEPSIQALSYRILYSLKDNEWASDILNSVEFDENVIDWALSIYSQADKHIDAFGVELSHGDTVILTQGLNVKGTSFSAPKGTIVRKIRLVADNTGQIEGKINEQTIVILTKYVKKSA